MGAKPPRTPRNDDEDQAVTAAAAGDVAGDGDQLVDDGREPIDAVIISGPDVPTTDIARRDESGMEVEGYVAANHPAMVMLNTWLAERVAVGNDADMAIAEIIAQVLSADSLDEILADHEAISLSALMDIPLRFHKVKPLKSSYEALAPWFVFADVTRLDTGERVGVTTGAQTVLAQFVRAAMLDLFPFDCVAVKATKKPTASGYWPYKLSRVKPVEAK